MLNLFSETAFAQAAAPAAQPSIWEMMAMPLGLLAIMYFFMIRPNQKRMKDHNNFLSSMKAGDEVVTTGGIIGRVKSVQETFVSIEIASDTVIKVVKSEVSGLSTKGAAVASATAKA